MSTINVEYSDGTETTVTGFFGSTQDPEVFPNQGTLETSDARWKTYYEAQPAAMQSMLPPPG
jgi:hypothetical protein